MLPMLVKAFEAGPVGGERAIGAVVAALDPFCVGPLVVGGVGPTWASFVG